MTSYSLLFMTMPSGRRQIEMYSKLIHTVDHVEGYLRDGFDALDAFLCHTWAVTVTGTESIISSIHSCKSSLACRQLIGLDV